MANLLPTAATAAAAGRRLTHALTLWFILPRRPDLNARMPGYQVNMGFGLHVGE